MAKENRNMESSPMVAVLMSTYNGQRFLREQIDSILSQSGTKISLIVRDDGSSDNTLNILNEYVDRITILKGSNCGCKASFFNVAKYAIDNLPDCLYFAFSDQDDYWKPDKISRAIDMLRQYEHLDIPLLYICPTTLTDQNLQPLISYKKRNYKYTLEEAMMLGTCAGCTMVFNRRLLELFLLANPSDMFLHDDWIYKVCLACDGKLLVDDTSFILYRQHGNNVVGGNQGKISSWKRRMRLFKEGSVRSSKAQVLLRIYENYISDEAKKTLMDVACYKDSFMRKCSLLYSGRYKTSNWIFNAIFKIAVVFNRF